MTEKNFRRGKLHEGPSSNDLKPSSLVKWTENGAIQRGVITRIVTRHGKKYFDVMSIFGKRRILRQSLIKPVILNDDRP